MFHINVLLKVKDLSDIEEIRQLLGRCQELSRQEEGCERFEVYQSQAEEDRFFLCEHWSDRAAWEAHKEREAFGQLYAPLVMPRVEREPHISTLLGGEEE